MKVILVVLLAVAPLMAKAADTVLEEIVVTAQKREQSLQDIPASVTAIPAARVEDLMSSGENIRALSARTPSLNVESSNGRQSPRFYIRGIGNYDFDVNATQPVSLILDEVALENSVLKSLPLYDVERVEVLAGPQGTLFGRSTTAGVVKIDTVKPGQGRGGFVSAGYGSRNNLHLTGAMDAELSDTIAARLSVNYLDRGGWINNTVTGGEFGSFDELSYRLQFLVTPSDELSALFKLHGFNQQGDMPQVFYANAFTPGVQGLRDGFDPEVASHDAPARFELDHIGASARIEYQFDTLKLTSITAYDTVENFSQADIDGGLQGGPEAIGVLGRQAFFSVSSGDGLSDHHQFSQELRFSAEQDNLFYQFGVYFFDEAIVVDSSDFANSGARLTLTQVDQETRSMAVFGQVEFNLSDQLAVILGGRYTSDEKDLEVIPGPGSTAPAATIADDDSYFSWEVAGNYALNEDVSLYARVATASRGPVTLGRFGFTSQASTETITSWEAGFKASIADGRARVSGTMFSWKIDDQQLTATGGSGNTNTILNADTEGAGVEAAFEALLGEYATVTINASYNKTEITEAGLLTELCSATPLCTTRDPIVDTFPGFFGTVNLVSVVGNPLPRAPELMFNVILEIERPVGAGSAYFVNDWNYRGESNIFLYDSVEFVSEPRWLGGLRLGYRWNDGQYDLSLVGRNITDEIVAEGALDFLNLTAFVNEPRYVGAEFRARF
ncbi:MAG: TonB-dependent receptor [Pseudomonadota bacterium]